MTPNMARDQCIAQIIEGIGCRHDCKKCGMKYSFFQTPLVFCESIKVKISYVGIHGRPLTVFWEQAGFALWRHILWCQKRGEAISFSKEAADTGCN